MNKKVVLSVLSTAVVASMATAAFAKPSTGLYIGGSVDKYYSITQFLNNEDQVIEEINNTGFGDVLYVDDQGKAATIGEVVSADDLDDVLETATLEDFKGNTYAKADGTTYDPSTDSDLTGAPAGDLKVESVSAINLTQVKVEFSSAVEETSAETAGNYTVSGYAGTIVPTLLEDGKTVVLTLSAQTQSSKASVSVANVQNEEGKKIETKISEVTFSDVTAPTIAAVKAVGNKSVVVTLSEPVSGLTAADFKLNGNDLSIYGGLVPSTGFVASNGGNDDIPTNQQYTLTFNNALPSGNYNLQFASTTARVDAAGFPLAAVTKAFTVDGVTTAPVATVTEAKSGSFGTVKVTFDHKMDASTLAGNFFLNDSSIGTTVTPVLGTDGKTVTLTFANVPAGANILLINPAVADTYGNKVTTATTPVRVNFTASADTQAPTLVSATSATETSVTLNFDEALDSLTANNAVNYEIKDANGVKVAPLTTRALAPNLGGVGNKQVSITLGSKLPGGTYTITVSGVKDAAGNAITATSKTFTVTDLTAPALADKDGNGKAAVHNATNHTVEVFFTEPMQTSGAYSILDKANWQYKGANVPTYVTLTAGANNKSVIFQFAATDSITANDTFTALVVKDVAGNTARNLSTTVVAASSVDGPVILDGTVKALAGTSTTDVLTFDVDQTLTSLEANDFSVSVDGGTAFTADNATLNGKTVTLTFANSKLADGRDITLDVVGPVGTKNANGAAIDTEEGDPLNAVDAIAPTVSSAAVTDNDTLTITFNEPLNGGLGALFKNDFLIDNNGATVAPKASRVNGNKLELDLPTNTNFGLVVKAYPVETPANVQDEAGNKYVPTTTEKSSGIAVTAQQSAQLDAADITVVNNLSAADTITVADLAAGDVVKVYDAATAGDLLGTATVASAQTTATVSVAQLGAGAGNVYVTVTNPNKTESARTAKAFSAEPAPAADNLSEVTATFDGLTVTTVTGTVTTDVAKIEVFDAAGDSLGVKTLSSEESFEMYLPGVTAGATITVKAFDGDDAELDSEEVTVAAPANN